MNVPRNGIRLTALSVLFLCGCSSVEERQARVLNAVDVVSQTASGAIGGAVTAGATVVETVTETAAEAARRARQVQEGVEKIQEGRELIEGAL